MNSIDQARAFALKTLAEGGAVEISFQVASGTDGPTLVDSMKNATRELLGAEARADRLPANAGEEHIRYRFTLEEPVSSEELPPAEKLSLI